VPDHISLLNASGVLIRCHLAKGQLEEALSAIEVSQELLPSSAVVENNPIMGNGISEAYLGAVENDTGTARQDWLKKAKRNCSSMLKVTKSNRTALPDSLLLQGRYEWLRGKSIAAEKWWGKAMDESRRLKDPYMEGMVHLEIGRRTGDREHLQQAESILREIGAEFDFAAARAALADLASI
jgi:tetratricopeptide (TPR) repeat protein